MLVRGSMEPRHEAEGWIAVSESAQEMLRRVSIERPCLIAVPPLHRVPLRPGNVVELVGPSPSAKSEILLQAAIKCILPNICNGVFFGGMERLVMYFDLDCSFDVQRFSNSLKTCIAEVCGNPTFTFGRNKHSLDEVGPLDEQLHFNEDVYLSCMKRFSYIRCYNSYEFLASLKTIWRRIQKESEAHGVGVSYLMIDSISAFYWMDRAASMGAIGGSRNCLSFQSVTEAIVQELCKLLHVLPVLVIATKTTISGMSSTACENDRNTFEATSSGTGSVNSNKSRESHNPMGFNLYQEYMPPAWQALVTQRVFLQAKRDKIVGDEKSLPTYVSTWLLPVLNLSDIFIVREVVNIKLQQQRGLSVELLKYKGPVHCARTIIHEGLSGLWSGAAPTVMRNGTNHVAMFTAKNAFDTVLWNKHEGDGRVLQPWQSMISGFLAGTAGPVCTGPFDVVKARLMAQSKSEGEVKYRGMLNHLCRGTSGLMDGATA